MHTAQSQLLGGSESDKFLYVVGGVTVACRGGGPTAQTWQVRGNGPGKKSWMWPHLTQWRRRGRAFQTLRIIRTKA